MITSKINSVDDIYRFVERLKAEAEKHDRMELATELDDALHLGSSGLEILGGIRQVIVNNASAIEQLLGRSGKEEAEQIVAFVDKTFGR